MIISERCVSPLLLEILSDIMKDSLFDPFRLVGGTNLALRTNHRISTDIDLFTDAPYGSLNFRLYDTKDGLKSGIIILILPIPLQK